MVQGHIGGIDYSLTSPSICVYSGELDKFNFNDCKIHFLSNKKKYQNFKYKNIQGVENISTHTSPEERYDYISQWAVNIFDGLNPTMIGIEDYSYGSTGKVFHIAENCGLLKWKLWSNKYSYEVHPPTVIKKFATGKGNANKEAMFESFVAETGVNLNEILEIKSEKIGNPVSDIIDSYYICKYQIFCLTNGE